MHFKTRPLLVATALCVPVCAIAAETYLIDRAHTIVSFSVRHLGINNIKGQFNDFAGSITVDKGAIKDANGTIQVKSIDTEVPKRDDHLRTADFFDAATYPTITFKTKRVEQSGTRTNLIADFTMRGVTKEIRLPVTLTGPVKDSFGSERIGLHANTKLNRKDYGIKYHELLETGIPAVGDEIEIEINAEAIKDTGKNPQAKRADAPQ